MKQKQGEIKMGKEKQRKANWSFAASDPGRRQSIDQGRRRLARMFSTSVFDSNNATKYPETSTRTPIAVGKTSRTLSSCSGDNSPRGLTPSRDRYSSLHADRGVKTRPECGPKSSLIDGKGCTARPPTRTASHGPSTS